MDGKRCKPRARGQRCNVLKWKTKYGGMEAADIRRLRELEDENRRLKQMSAELLLENRALKDVIAKKL